MATAHSDLGEDARVLFNGVTITISVPSTSTPILEILAMLVL